VTPGLTVVRGKKATKPEEVNAEGARGEAEKHTRCGLCVLVIDSTIHEEHIAVEDCYYVFDEVTRLYAGGEDVSVIYRELLPIINEWPNHLRPSLKTFERHTRFHMTRAVQLSRLAAGDIVEFAKGIAEEVVHSLSVGIKVFLENVRLGKITITEVREFEALLVRLEWAQKQLGTQQQQEQTFADVGQMVRAAARAGGPQLWAWMRREIRGQNPAATLPYEPDDVREAADVEEAKGLPEIPPGVTIEEAKPKRPPSRQPTPTEAFEALPPEIRRRMERVSKRTVEEDE
jgi:hypothetical protein